jgi:hypothetical protein
MDLTRCLEIKTRCGVCSVIKIDQMLLLRPLQGTGLTQQKSRVNRRTVQLESKKHNSGYPFTSAPGVIKSDVPTPGGYHHTIRIRLPCYIIEVLAEILVLDACFRREGNIDCSFTLGQRRCI